MAQFALLDILVVLPLQLLSGGGSRGSQPHWLQHLTFLLPSRHFVSVSQAIIYRGAGVDIVWPRFVIVTGLGLVCFLASLGLFRRSIREHMIACVWSKS
jgi:ABC-2 type transport system permease protein